MDQYLHSLKVDKTRTKTVYKESTSEILEEYPVQEKERRNFQLISVCVRSRDLLQRLEMSSWSRLWDRCNGLTEVGHANVLAPVPSSKRTEPTRTCVRTGQAATTRVLHGFPPNARKTSKYSKSTPLASNFSYLYHSTFHTFFNAGLKSCYSFDPILAIELGQLLT